MKKAAYIGRFQPVTEGHCHMIRKMAAEYGEKNSLVLIGVPMADKREMFSPTDVATWIRTLFPEMRLGFLPDFATDEEWLINTRKVLWDFTGGERADIIRGEPTEWAEELGNLVVWSRNE